MTEEELTIIEKRLLSTTKGIWKSYIEGRDHHSGSDFIMVNIGENRSSDIELSGASTEDQDFIASSKQDIPKLLEEIRRLKSIIQQLKNNKYDK